LGLLLVAEKKVQSLASADIGLANETAIAAIASPTNIEVSIQSQKKTVRNWEVKSCVDPSSSSATELQSETRYTLQSISFGFWRARF